MVKIGIMATGFNNLYYKGSINQSLVLMTLACGVSQVPNIKLLTPNMCFLAVILSIFIKNWYL